MNLKQGPFRPLSHFLQLITPFERGLIAVFWGALVLVSLALLWQMSEPIWGVAPISEVSEAVTSPVPVDTVTVWDRSFPLSLNAYRQWVSFSAGPLLPSAWPVVCFWLLQLLAWGILLAFASGISSRWAYVWYLLYGIWIFSTGVGSMLFPEQEFYARGLDSLYLVLSLGLAYAFQVKLLRLSLLVRSLLLVALTSAYVCLPLAIGGWKVWHQLSIHNYPILLGVALIFAWFIGKEPINILLAVANHRRDPRSRWDYRLVFGAIILVLIYEGLLLAEYLGLGNMDQLNLWIRPVHLLLLSAVAMPLTSHPHFVQVKGGFNNPGTYTVLLLCLGLITLSFTGLNYAAGESMFHAALEGVLIVFFFAQGLTQLLIVWANYPGALRKKEWIFPALPYSRGIRYQNVWLVALVAVISAGGYNNWESATLFFHTYANHRGDQAMLQENQPEATRAYQAALSQSPNSAKPNYNLGGLALQAPLGPEQRLQRALGYYDNATKRFAYPPARLNAANLLLISGRVSTARETLSAGLKQQADPYLANNLAMSFRLSGPPDSMIYYLKQGLLTDPDQAALYSNLANVYWDQEEKEWAGRFFEMAQEATPSSEAALANHLFYQLQQGKTAESLRESVYQSNYFYAYNALLGQAIVQPQGIDVKRLKALLQESQYQAPEVLLLDAYHLMAHDSVAHAVSRVNHMGDHFASHAAAAHYLMGVDYFSNKVPELAQQQFQSMGKAGDTRGFLYAVQMEIDQGLKDSAFLHLDEIRVQYDNLWEAASKEKAMLSLPYLGEDAYLVQRQLSTLSFEEWLRTGRYADSMNQFATAQYSFGNALNMDSSYRPYLGMARIYNRYSDTVAIPDLKAGLKVVSKNQAALRLELARAYLIQGALDEAQKQWEQAYPDRAFRLEAWQVASELALAKQDTAQALIWLDSAYQAEPLNPAIIQQLAQVLYTQKAYELGSSLIGQALELNPENPGIWYHYARFSQATGLDEDAGHGALKAISLLQDPQRIAEIRAEFGQEIKLITDRL